MVKPLHLAQAFSEPQTSPSQPPKALRQRACRGDQLKNLFDQFLLASSMTISTINHAVEVKKVGVGTVTTPALKL